MKDKDKLEIAIYKVNPDCKILSQAEDKVLCISSHIISKNYIQQTLKTEKIDDNHQIKIFYRKTPSNPAWKEFLTSVVEENQNILKLNQGWNESFVMIIESNKNCNIYIAAGGLGYHAISEIIDEDFGVDILSRLIKPEDKILKSVKEKSVIGGILGTTKHFRKNLNFFENDGFGKIYQELKTSINKEILKSKFGFTDDDLKRETTCLAKASFKINRSITLEHLSIIISGCEYVLENPDNNPDLEPICINSVEKIIKKQKPQLIESLEKKLIEQLWSRYSNPEDGDDFGLCHRDFESYLTADKYIVTKGKKNFFNEFEFKDEDKLDNIDILFKQIKNFENSPQDIDQFSDLITSLAINSYSSENVNSAKTIDSIFKHIFGEITLNNEKYFFVDNNWYRIKNDFITKLNQHCQSFIVKHSDNGLNKEWDYGNQNENSYNASYVDDSQTLVLDKITPNNIEPCDVLKWDDDCLYLYHVKAGFSNTMRDACSQVQIAASRILNDMNSDKSYINEIYSELERTSGSTDPYFSKISKQVNSIDRETFISLFDKKLVFVLAIVDTAKNPREFKLNIEAIDSNIAKFSLDELSKTMKGLDIELRVQQVSRKQSKVVFLDKKGSKKVVNAN